MIRGIKSNCSDLKSERRIVNNPYLDKLGQEEKYQEQQEFVGLGSLK